ncbi:hypothetical protein [Streptomyces sp. NPDC005547]|uniref:hypothetical protein n=1 Tax=Streptomyces sp. NPDC005547 TaxID=3154887 RepID=UPI0033B43F5E
MTTPDDPLLVEAIWRAGDLTRAYLVQDCEQVSACLTGLDTAVLDRVLAWLALDHDKLFGDLGEPAMSLRELDEAAALAPLEVELAVTTAVRRVATGETGLTGAVEALAPLDRIHAVAICTTVLQLEAYGRDEALAQLDVAAARCERMGHHRPYPNPIV